MTTIDKSGTSLEDIIHAFRQEYSIRDWELKYEILKKPSKGIFGLFASKTALVRFQVPGVDDRAKLFIHNLLTKMGISFDKITPSLQGKTLYLEIVGCKDPGFLIGKNGSMLETIQFLVNRIFEFDRKIDKIYLDADGYRERREAMFIRQFMPLISKIKIHGKPLTLEPMNAGERRIIHRHVERDKGLRTLTIGEGDMKRIVIFSSKQSEKEAMQQSKAETSGTATTEAPAKTQTQGDRPQRSPRQQRAPRPNQNKKPVDSTEEKHAEEKPVASKPTTKHSNQPRRRPPRPPKETKEPIE
ncbi:MAG: Jag N-terminal domain-containing protein [Candidatus Cloacimonas sp.]|jgi:spoIIIJ-associated protein|nr:Jag N-terminal domain-containing protein [Candidatus Cloacimonas sp.]